MLQSNRLTIGNIAVMKTKVWYKYSVIFINHVGIPHRLSDRTTIGLYKMFEVNLASRSLVYHHYALFSMRSTLSFINIQMLIFPRSKFS